MEGGTLKDRSPPTVASIGLGYFSTATRTTTHITSALMTVCNFVVQILPAESLALKWFARAKVLTCSKTTPISTTTLLMAGVCPLCTELFRRVALHTELFRRVAPLSLGVSLRFCLLYLASRYLYTQYAIDTIKEFPSTNKSALFMYLAFQNTHGAKPMLRIYVSSVSLRA